MAKGVSILIRLPPPKLYLPWVLPISTDPFFENSQTVALESDIRHLPAMARAGSPQPAIAHSVTASTIALSPYLLRPKIDGTIAKIPLMNSCKIILLIGKMYIHLQPGEMTEQKTIALGTRSEFASGEAEIRYEH
jgi:hypothetical protein